MSLDLSQVAAAEMLVARLSLPDGTTLALQSLDETNASGYKTELELDDTRDWDVTYEFSESDGQKAAVRIIDDTDIAPAILKSSEVLIEGSRYRIGPVDKPRGATRIWTLHCQATGE